MGTAPIRRGLALPALLLVAVSCSQDMPPAEPLGELVEPDAELSRVRYWDRGLVSLNDRCPNTQTRLSPAIEPVYVNGRPIGFC